MLVAWSDVHVNIYRESDQAGGQPKVMKAYNVVSQTCLVSRCRTDVFDDCAAPRLFVDIVKLPLKPFLLPVRHACCVVR
jgi:hypothetical protein